MPFVFIVIGLLFLVVAVRGTQSQMFALLKSEFVGTNSFVPWVSAILILGAIGYAKPLKGIADAMIGLVLLVLIINNKGGFFSAFNQQIRNPTAISGASTSSTSSTSSLTTALANPASQSGSLLGATPAPNITGNATADLVAQGINLAQ